MIGVDVDLCQRVDALLQRRVGRGGKGRQGERVRAPAAREGQAFVVRGGEVVRLLGDRVAEALQLSRCLQDVHERTLDAQGQLPFIDRLSAERTASVDRLRLDEPLGFPHQRRARQDLCSFRRNERVPAFECVGVDARGGERGNLGQKAVAVGGFCRGGAGANRGGEPGGIDHVIERGWRLDAQHPADGLKAGEHRVVGDDLAFQGQGATARLDLVLGGLRLLAELVPRPLQVFTKAFDGVETQDLDQRLPFFRLGLVDEVGQRAPAKQEGLPPHRLACLG